MEKIEKSELRREKLVLAALILLTFLVRVLFLSAWADTALFYVPVGDSKNFHDTALALLGKGPPAGAFVFQPLYTFYLVAVYSIFGVSVVAARTVQLFFVVAGCVPIFLLGRRLAGTWAGYLSVLWYAFYGPMVFLGSMMLAPALVVPLFALALWALVEGLERRSPRFLLLAGVSFGLACMGRPNLAILLPVAGIWMLVELRPAARLLPAIGCAAVGLVVGLCPSWLYNAVHGQGLVPVSSSGGINFFIGNNPEASGRFHLPRGIIEKGVSGVSHSGFWQGFRSIAEKAEGRPLSASEVSSFWYRRGFEFWFDAPSEALRLTGRKLLMSLSGGEMSVHHPYEFGKTLVPWLGRLPGFGVVFPFALLGLVLGWRNPTVRWLAAMLGAYWLTMLLFFVADRFRIVMLPLLAVSAAAGMVLFVENLRRGSRTRVWPCMTLMAVAFIVTTNPTYGDRVARKYAASGYNRLGKAEADRGHYRLAMMHFGRSLSLYPSGIAYMNLASLFARKGDFQRAKEIYQKVVHFYPGMRRIALVKLAHIAQLQGDLDEAVRFLQRAAGLMADPSSVEKKIEALEKRMGNRRRRPRDR